MFGHFEEILREEKERETRDRCGMRARLSGNGSNK